MPAPASMAASLAPAPTPWSQERTLWLAGQEEAQLPQHVKLLDMTIGSVAKAVKLLNLGVVYCPEDLCMVFSEKEAAYYLLYRQGSKSAAYDIMEELAAASDLSTPHCSTPSFPRPRRCSETPLKFRNPRPGGEEPVKRAPATSPPRSFAHRNLECSPPGSPSPQLRDEVPVVPEAASMGYDNCSEGTRDEVETNQDDTEDTSDIVDVGGRWFRLHGIIGRGAFGVVWRAREQGREDEAAVAIKAMAASTEDGFSTALFEAELLRRLATHLPADTAGRVPKYVAHSAIKLGAGGQVHLAMSFLPGQVLDQWLYGISDEAHKHVDVTKIVHGALPGSRQRTLSLDRACSLVHDLLQQLAGVFEALQPLALHRDVSSHNVLLDFTGGAEAMPSFALIDFGLAVGTSSWSREWNTSNLAGDPRYWTPAAWMALALGFRHVEGHSNRGFQRQYLGRIDHYSLGILALELFFALWDPDTKRQQEQAPGLRHARTAWCALWDLKFRLFQMFHLQGAKQTQHYLEYSPQNPLERFGELLACCYRSLRAAAAHPANAERASLLRILADLIDENGVMRWTEIGATLRAPSAAESAVAGSFTAAAPPRSPLPHSPTMPLGSRSMNVPMAPMGRRCSLGPQRLGR